MDWEERSIEFGLKALGFKDYRGNAPTYDIYDVETAIKAAISVAWQDGWHDGYASGSKAAKKK